MEQRFSWLYDASPAAGRLLWDRLLLQSPDAKTIPTLGSLVPGWVLTFSARPTVNLRALGDAERSALLAQSFQAAEVVTRFGSRLFQFEHGAGSMGSPLGCGLDIAHLHTVPLAFDLIEAAMRHSPSSITWKLIEDDGDPWQFATSAEYVVIREPAAKRAAVGTVHQPVSQLIRKVIAAELSSPDRWDYRAHDGLANVEATVGAFADHDRRA